MELKKTILKACMQKGFLLDKEILDKLANIEASSAIKMIEVLANLHIKEKVINKSVFETNLTNLKKIFASSESDKSVLLFLESFSASNVPQMSKSLEVTHKEKGLLDIKLLSSNIVIPKKVEVKDFVSHFRNRYEQIRKILQERNLENLKSIRRIGNDRDKQFIIVAILEKRQTKNKNLIFEVEDLTGRSRVLINQNKAEIYEKCKDILPDEVVAFDVTGTSEILFANDVIFPDAQLAEKRKSTEEILVAFSSDVHVGSKMFLEENFLRFIKWINGEEGEEKQKEYAKKIKYLFLVGDNVDGVGVFPDQDKLLKIQEISAQYKKLAEYLKLIRKDIRLIISPGQHDAVWVGEPQPTIGEEWAPDLYKMENVSLVTNPCLVEIAGGFKVLVYHGASMHGVIEEMPDLRLNYGHKSPTRVVKELLKRRHLAPIHGSCDYVPNETRDPLAIDIIPDIVVTGDLHRQEISTYNNILLVSSSCWQSMTPFEEKVGNVPDPSKVPVLNLKTREIKIFDFNEDVGTPIQGVGEQKCEEKNGEIVCSVPVAISNLKLETEAKK